MRKSLCLLPLALGTFGLGLTEYVMMGILPDIAKSMQVSITMAGHFISLYALGVVAGSVLLVIIGRNKPLKTVLLALATIFTVANLLSAFAPNYYLFCPLRFIAGLPHGAFFGVGAIVAQKLADKGKANQAVAYMVSGMTVANLAGIPIGTYLSHNFSWRITFTIIGLFGLLIIYSIKRLIPQIAPLPDTGFRGQFQIFKSLAPWLLILSITMSNGGIFCWYSYINPLLVHLSGIKPVYVSLLMIFAGGGMVVGNYIGGKLSDKYGPSLFTVAVQLLSAIALFLIFLYGYNPYVSVILMCICTGCLFAVSAPQQYLLIKYSKGGEILGASSSQISFNLGNALGAFVGGIPISYGLSYKYVALPGTVLTIIGFCVLCFFYNRYERI